MFVCVYVSVYVFMYVYVCMYVYNVYAYAYIYFFFCRCFIWCLFYLLILARVTLTRELDRFRASWGKKKEAKSCVIERLLFFKRKIKSAETKRSVSSCGFQSGTPPPGSAHSSAAVTAAATTTAPLLALFALCDCCHRKA